MKFKFLLEDVDIELTDHLPPVDPVLYRAAGLEANEDQFRIHVADVGSFYSEGGRRVLLKPEMPLKKDAIHLYLNGSILGSILHQRQILALHASSFQLNGNAVIVCGDSGFGKSSITFSMCKNHDAHFLTDDITPIRHGRIMQISESLKLWQDALDQLGFEDHHLQRVHEEMDKFYVSLKGADASLRPDIILFGEIGGSEVSFQTLNGAEKFEKTLLNQYWKELTTSMQASRARMFDEITALCHDIPMYLFKRPENHPLEETTSSLIKFLENR